MEVLTRAQVLFDSHLEEVQRRASRMFAGLMAGQWILGVVFAVWISPKTWEGLVSRTHLHVYAAVFLGGLITALPVFLALKRPAWRATRHVVAAGQMLTSALLIHLTGGRIETHFHVFGSLAFLAFYRDWRPLVTATIIVALDHAIRGIYWPQSVYGVALIQPVRFLEHTGWVLFEDVFLIRSILQSLEEMRGLHSRQAELEATNQIIESRVAQRTSLLSAQLAVTRALSEAGAVSESLAKVVRVICESLGWALGAVWLVDESTSELRCEEAWAASETLLKEFAGVCRRLRFRSGIGLPGRVWASGKPAWIRDVVLDANFVRAPFAVKTDLHGACCFPIIHRGYFMGVIEFFSSEIKEPNDSLLEMMAATGIQIGQFSQRKIAEEAMRESDRRLRQSEKLSAIGQLAAGVAHEINNPLGVILGFAEGVAERVPESDVLFMPLTSIRREALRCKKLVENLLTFSRQGARSDEAFDLDLAIGDALALIKAQVRVKNIELIEDLTPCGNLKGDRNQIQQALINLCSNAIDALPDGGRLAVKTAIRHREGARWIVLEVKDNGVGIPDEIRDKIFLPFFTTKEQGKGTGLGLALAHECVQKHGGTMEVQSQVGVGTTFTIELPSSQDAGGGAHEDDQGHVGAARGAGHRA